MIMHSMIQLHAHDALLYYLTGDSEILSRFCFEQFTELFSKVNVVTEP